MSSSKMCAFDAETLRCGRCGYKASALPTFRECRTVVEMAQDLLEQQTQRRVRVPAIPLGSAVSSALSAAGATPERVSKLLGRDCGCKARAVALDYVGAGISRAVEKAANYALNLALPSGYTTKEVAEVANSIAASPWLNDGLRDNAAVATSTTKHPS